MTAVLLVRHARAGKRQEWEGDDRLRPLSPKGFHQADALVPVIAKLLGSQSRTVRLLSSSWLRCRQTLAPLSFELGSQVIDTTELGEGMGEQAVKLVVGMAKVTAVCCTHGDVIGEILLRMHHDGLDLGPEPTWPKGSVWLLQSRQGTFRSARYIAPRI